MKDERRGVGRNDEKKLKRLLLTHPLSFIPHPFTSSILIKDA